jgi:toxin HigB-1
LGLTWALYVGSDIESTESRAFHAGLAALTLLLLVIFPEAAPSAPVRIFPFTVSHLIFPPRSLGGFQSTPINKTEKTGLKWPKVQVQSVGERDLSRGEVAASFICMLKWLEDSNLVIRSFACRETEKVFRREGSRRFPGDVQRRRQRKLELLDAAERLEDLRVPPGNQLEKLRGGREGQWSVRVNDQWRVCFRWQEDDAFDVEIIDYH